MTFVVINSLASDRVCLFRLEEDDYLHRLQDFCQVSHTNSRHRACGLVSEHRLLVLCRFIGSGVLIV